MCIYVCVFVHHVCTCMCVLCVACVYNVCMCVLCMYVFVCVCVCMMCVFTCV